MVDLKDRVAIDEAKTFAKTKAKLYFTAMSSLIDVEFGLAREFFTTLIDKATKEEIDQILESVDKAGSHLLQAWDHATDAFVVGASIAERAEEDPAVMQKKKDLQRQAEHTFQMIEGAIDDYADLGITGSDYFSRIEDALSGEERPEANTREE
jgi:hypothetical protein